MITIMNNMWTCYASGTRWTLDHAVSPVALEHDLPTILDFPEEKKFSSYLHVQGAPIDPSGLRSLSL